MTTPVWQAAHNGIPGRLDATNQSAHINQLLGTHAIQPIYDGVQILTPGGGTQFLWLTYGNSNDLSQPFTLSGTTVGRVVLPVLANGNGADMTVLLCADNGSGSPLVNTPLASCTVPAGIINQLSAVDGLENATTPLATQWSNTMYGRDGITFADWAGPTGDGGGVATDSSIAVSGSYFIFAGGSTGTTNAVTGVSSAQYLGGGQLAQGVAQTPLPVAAFNPAITTTSSSVIVMGGMGVSAALNDVWVASWDPLTGLIGSWSQQTVLPVAQSLSGSATWNDATIYCVGGNTDLTGITALSTFYWNTISNGQLGTWNVGPKLPLAVACPYTAVIGNWLIVASGQNIGGSPTNGVYYSALNPTTGEPGPWQTGPVLPDAAYAYSCGYNMGVTDNALIVMAGLKAGGATSDMIRVLTVTEDGLSPTWQQSFGPNLGALQIGAFNVGSGNWDLVQPDINFSDVYTAQYGPVPYLSVPLYATGLTGGNTYHVVLRQHQNATSTDYLGWGALDDTALPIPALSAQRHVNTWTAADGTYAVPMNVFDASATGMLRHTWEDPNGYSQAQRTSTMLYGAPSNLLLGVTEATLQPNIPRNANPTFTTGVTPWTVSGGTFVQSAAQTQGGFAFSGLFTPNGSAAAPSVSSELFSVGQGGGPFYGNASWYLLDGWLYSPPGDANVFAIINWFDQGSSLLSVALSSLSLAAATWTHVQLWGLAPATACQAQIEIQESGTPASAKTIYLSNVFVIASQECVGSLASAAAVEYGSPPWPPIGVTQLL